MYEDFGGIMMTAQAGMYTKNNKLTDVKKFKYDIVLVVTKGNEYIAKGEHIWFSSQYGSLNSVENTGFITSDEFTKELLDFSAKISKEYKLVKKKSMFGYIEYAEKI